VYLFPGDRSLGIGGGGRARDAAKQDAYNKIFRQQLREALEIASKHAPLTEVWFDGSCAVEVGDIIRQCAPNAVVFQGPQASIRWVGNEAGQLEYDKSWSTLAQKELATGLATARHSDPNGDAWAPLEVNTRLYARHWFWSPKNESTRKSLDELMRFYYASAGQGAVVLLNSTPNTDGLIPEGDVKRYRELGDEIRRRFDKPLAQASGSGETIELDLGSPSLVNHAVIMEDYVQGERIRGYVLEGFDGKKWAQLSQGSHVGRKRIDCFPDAVVSRLRLRVTQSAGQPLIRSFQAFRVSNFRLAEGQPLRSGLVQCGSWRSGDFRDGKTVLDLKLTGYITEAGQWEVVFQPAGGGELTLKDEMMVEEGIPAVAGSVQRTKDLPNSLHVTRAASVTKESRIQLKVTLEAKPCDGAVQIREVAH
jgi:alpha-L-fucosidase